MAELDYRDTVNLPKTDFPMKASLPLREPLLLERWEEAGIFRKMVEKNRGKEKFGFHDGPPYANGHLHLGHVLNKVLKDLVVKYMNMAGKETEFVPGWDCHGLPIELKTEEELGGKRKEMEKVAFRRACRAYAERYVAIQRDEFKRLGVFARWENPYLTMTHGYEAETVRVLRTFAERGSLIRGKKPVYWCVRDRTALAEAEVEYADHASPSIYVAWPLESELVPGRKVELVIWTTTPWTLPANLAIAVHPTVSYVVYDLDGRALLVAKPLLGAFLAACGRGDADPSRILATFEGKALEGKTYRHVLNGRKNPVILADHVTTDSGTGLVHTAPGHGPDDFEVGRKYGLEVLSPVDAAGRFTEEAGDEWKGQGIFEANPKIVEKLHALGVLLSDPKASLGHSYPHCWRCKRPVIFRATSQWFISMAEQNLREKALAEVEKVEWIPKWGRDRIHGMIATRPDWCVSRQRTWGVPIPVFYCEQCEEPRVDPKAMGRVAEIFEKESADAWYAHPAEYFLEPGTTCAKCGHAKFIQETDILDVWFDSGVSWAAVVAKEPGMQLPVDLYLEGSDQHRGWFHSSLLAAVGTMGKAPYKAALTHGFFVDGAGKKISKSSSNYIPVEKVVAEQGAEILRLWVASSDYRDDVRISKEILTSLSEGYRKIRNTFRYALGNLEGFDPKADAVAEAALAPIDRWALARLSQVTAKVRKAYETYEFHVVYHSVLEFCAVDLSAIYFDILKDRLYTHGTRSPSRRGAQTVLHTVLVDLLRLLAPMMSFTCDEAYGFLPHREAESVFLLGMPVPAQRHGDEALLAEFEKLFAIRAQVQKALEEARREKVIGSSLEAHVRLPVDEASAILKAHEAVLPAFFIVSKVTLTPGGNFEILRAPGIKCPRCWTYNEGVAEEAPLCPKCREALAAP